MPRDAKLAGYCLFLYRNVIQHATPRLEGGVADTSASLSLCTLLPSNAWPFDMQGARLPGSTLSEKAKGKQRAELPQNIPAASVSRTSAAPQSYSPDIALKIRFQDSSGDLTLQVPPTQRVLAVKHAVSHPVLSLPSLLPDILHQNGAT